MIHNPQEWPLIDEFGIDINPATYTLAAISEVIEFVKLFICISLVISFYKIVSRMPSLFTFQIKLQRQEDPYPSNCSIQAKNCQVQ